MPFPTLHQASRRYRKTNAAAGGGGYTTVVLADSPLAYWRLGEPSGTTAADASGNGHAGTYNAVTLAAAGAISDGDTAISFSAFGTQSFRATGVTGLDGGVVSYEFWIKTTDTSSGQSLSSGPGFTFAHGASVGGKPSFTFTKTFNAFTTNSTVAVNDGSWHHVVCTVEVVGSNYVGTIYIDGASAGTGSMATAGSGSFITGSALVVGDDTGGQHTPAVTFDEFAVYGAALSSTRAAAHHAAA